MTMKTEFLKGNNEKETITFFVADHVWISYCFLELVNTRNARHQRDFTTFPNNEKGVENTTHNAAFLKKFEVGEYSISMTLVF